MSRSPGDLIVKDPSSVELQGCDWTAYLTELGTGVTISTSTWSVTGTGLTLSGDIKLAGSLKTQVTLTAGTLGTRYTLTNHIVTSSGVTDERSFDVLIENK